MRVLEKSSEYRLQAARCFFFTPYFGVFASRRRNKEERESTRPPKGGTPNAERKSTGPPKGGTPNAERKSTGPPKGGTPNAEKKR
jgi:hypothetical protein